MNLDFSNLPQEERAQRLTALLLGELPAAETDALRAALAVDSELAREHKRLRQTIELVRETRAMERQTSAEGTPLRLNDTRRQKLLEMFQQPVTTPVIAPRRPRNLQFLPLALAAALVGLLVVSVMLPSLSKSKAKAERVTMLPAFGVSPVKSSTDFDSDHFAESAARGSALGEVVRVGLREREVLLADDFVVSEVNRQPALARPAVALVLPATSDALSDEAVRFENVSDFSGGQIAARELPEALKRSESIRDLTRADGPALSGGSSFLFNQPAANPVPTPGASSQLGLPSISTLSGRKSVAQATDTYAVVGQLAGDMTVALAVNNSITANYFTDSTAPVNDGRLGSLPPTAPVPSAVEKKNRFKSGGLVDGVDAIRSQKQIQPEARAASLAPKATEGIIEARRAQAAASGSMALPATPPPLETRSYPVDAKELSKGLGNVTAFSFGESQSGGGVGGRGGGVGRSSGRGTALGDVGGPQNSGGLQFQSQMPPAVLAPQSTMQNLFTTAGVDLTATGKSVSFHEQSGALTVTGTAADLDMVQKTMEVLNLGEPPLTIGAKFMNVEQDAAPAGLADALEAIQKIPSTAGGASVPTRGDSESQIYRLRAAQTVPSGSRLSVTSSPASEPVKESALKDAVRFADDGALVFINGITVASTNALLSNNTWDSAAGPGLPGHDSSWFGRTEATGASSAMNYQWKLGGENSVQQQNLPTSGSGIGSRLNIAVSRVTGGIDGDQAVDAASRVRGFYDDNANPALARMKEEGLIVGSVVVNGRSVSGQTVPTNQKALKDTAAEQRLLAPNAFARTNFMVGTNHFVARHAGIVAAKDLEKQLADSVPAKPASPAPTPQPKILTRDNAFSTFSLNVSDVSFKLAAASLEKGAMPDATTVRSEEFINAFDYRDPMPAAGVPVAFVSERARYPFAHNRDVLRFSVKTAAQGRDGGKPLNIVLLLDNSGSMERADRVQIIQEALRALAAQLQPQDKLSVVTFSRTARLWADGVTGAQAAEVAKKIAALTPEGGTNLEEALDLAYRTALRHYAATAINRVVLLTDGAANLGNVEPAALKAKVENFRKQGVALDCFGIGWEGFNDDLLENLSRNGDGRYGFVNTPEEAATEFAGQLAGALRVAASDVKVQVEFNPKRVTAYRQIGYAKHQLTKQQFRDNTVDAAEISASEAGNALYVIETNPRGEGPIATVRARFRIPQTSDYREHEWVVPFGSAVELEQSGSALRLATSASAFSEWLAGSPFAGEVTTDRLLGLLSGVPEVYGADPRPKKLEWMIRQAKSISGK